MYLDWIAIKFLFYVTMLFLNETTLFFLFIKIVKKMIQIYLNEVIF